MSNEELVAAIQSGENERMGELWAQIEKFIAWKAQRIMTTMDESSTIEVDDLIQSGYFALAAAVKSYKAGDGPFLMWLSYIISKLLLRKRRDIGRLRCRMTPCAML